MARVFTHNPDGWLLKGGLAMLVRYPGARYSRDLDLLHRTPEADLEEAVQTLLAAAAITLGDAVRFAHISTSGAPPGGGPDAVAGRPCRSVTFKPFLGTKKQNHITVDLVTDMDPVGQPQQRHLEPLINELPGSDVQLQLVALEDHLADKICAMYELHNGIPSSRVKDLVDLVYAISHDVVDGRLLNQALRKEVQRRTAQRTEITLPMGFDIPDHRSWAEGYARQVSTTDGFHELHSFEDAVALADAFLTPILRGDAVNQWSPTTQRWEQ
nr:MULTISPECIES: nucleotidyl transferase AbiEii/AbiGii toxin family protein [unclassified Actinopolyspora]